MIILRSILCLFDLVKQAEKLKSREMKEGWWRMMKDDEGWWRMNELWWRMNQEWWRMMISSCWGVLQTDWLTDERTFVIVESLSRLKTWVNYSSSFFQTGAECRWRVSPGHTRRVLLILPRLSLPPDCSSSFTVSRYISKHLKLSPVFNNYDMV